MGLVSRFPELRSNEASTPNGIWGWARRMTNALNRWKLFNLMDTPINDKPRAVIRVNNTGTDFELSKEVLDSLIGVSLVGKAGKAIIVNATEDGFDIAP
jgi:hypothetical protein